MKLITSLLVGGASLMYHSAAESTPPVFGYTELLSLCQGPSVYVAVRYQTGIYVAYSYGECYHYYEEKSGNPVETALFCKTSSCTVYQNNECTGPPNPDAAVVVTPALPIANPDDAIETIGLSAVCKPL